MEHITFHVDTDGKPYHMDYYLEGPPTTGACPSKKQLRIIGHETPLQRSNVTLGIRTVSHPPLFVAFLFLCLQVAVGLTVFDACPQT